MLKTIKNYFAQHLAPDDEPRDLDHKLKLATGALLIEMMYQDEQAEGRELEAVKAALKEKFALTETEFHDLFALAQEERDEAVDYYQFTRLIAGGFDQQQRSKVVELLWTVAYADGRLTALEEHMVRKIADLIYVSHKDFIQARHRVESRLKNNP